MGLHENAVMTSPSHAFHSTDHGSTTYLHLFPNRFASSRLKFFYIKHLQHTNTCSYACPAPWRGPRWGGASPVLHTVQSLTHTVIALGSSVADDKGALGAAAHICQAKRQGGHNITRGALRPPREPARHGKSRSDWEQSPRCATAVLGSVMPQPLTKTYCCHQGAGTCVPPLGSPRALAVVAAPAAAT